MIFPVADGNLELEDELAPVSLISHRSETEVIITEPFVRTLVSAGLKDLSDTES